MARRWADIMRVALSVAALQLPAPGRAETPDYFLDLDTGGHRATIRDVDVSADGAVVVTASDDKSVRVWDWRAGESMAILRGQIGPGAEGVINAVALSVDAAHVAIGGYFGAHASASGPFGDVRIFDLRSGAMTGVLKGHEWVVETIAYDAGRDELAVSGQGGLVYRWTAPFTDAPQQLPVLDTQALRVSKTAYALDGKRLIVATHDYGLRIWDLERGEPVIPPDNEALWDFPLVALAVSSDGARFALADDQGRVTVRSAGTGAVLSELPQRPFRVDAVSFVGDRLTVSCGYRCAGVHGTEVWEWAIGLMTGTYTAQDTGIHASAALPDGVVLTAGGRMNDLHLWRAESLSAVQRMGGIGAPVHAVGISRTADRIGWGTDDPCPERAICPDRMGPLTQEMELPTSGRSFSKPSARGQAGLGRAETNRPGMAVVLDSVAGSGFDGSRLVVGDAVIDKGPTDGYYHGAFTLLADAGLISGGGNGVLLAYGADGGFAGEFIGHTGEVLALATGGDRLLSGSADQTMKLWNLQTRELIVTLFFAGKDWIIWTPQGYFHSSPDGDRLVGWHINQGQDREGRYIRARQLRQHLHSPEIVRRAILLGAARQAALDLRGRDDELQELLTRRPPEFDIRLADDLPAPEGHAVIEVTGTALEEVESWGYSVLVNDRRVRPVRAGGGGGRLLYSVPVEDGENLITVSGRNEFGYVTERSAVALSKRKQVAEKKGKLFVAVVGVNKYPNLPDACGGKPCDLAYPVADALEFLNVVRERTAPMFTGMESLVMVSGEALSADEPRQAALSLFMDRADVLEPDARTVSAELVDFLTLPGPDDTTVIFVAGHGMNLDEQYYLLPTDAQKRGDRWRTSSLVDWGVIQEEISFAQGRRILVLDTCHAANAFNAKLEKEAADARVIVFSATAANNTAGERPDLGHGIFTYAMLQGLKGGADKTGEGVRLLGLADYVYHEVIRLSDHKQEPFYHISQTANFLMAGPGK
ncbi:caspase family protein [Thalassovita sp.]|uniref:caspase family protein n=1 Tax=Thalassovita sp. TaxID=1979401 RepID=UPI0029DE6C3D|nr:caspase family protein [Thalassovita sp.]